MSGGESPIVMSKLSGLCFSDLYWYIHKKKKNRKIENNSCDCNLTVGLFEALFLWAWP